MSRIEELKKQNPNFNLDGIAIINDSLGKVKYTEMAINLIKNKLSENNEARCEDLINQMQHEFGFDLESLKGLTFIELSNIISFISTCFGYNNFRLMKEFVNLNEKKLIENNDLTTYKTFDEVELQISLSSLKSIDKEMAKQVLKLYETDEWLVVKPLSYQASLKYGASTKWCTASKDSSDYYFRYSRRGILIYSINKKTGNKVAGFKNLDTSHESETSFWNITDQRIDSMDSGLPSDVLDIFRNEFSNTKQSNWDILTDEERNRQILWLENEYGSKKMSVSYGDYNAPVEEAIPMNEEVPIRNIRRRLTPVRRVTIDAEAELTRILEEQIMDEISSETLREITSDMRYNDVYGGDEYGGEEYPDQAG
jgi:hypothetical protein